MAYDIIGDVHGHASALKSLLTALGYREKMGAWRHPDRQAIFVGDLIDRGPEQLQTVELVRNMVDAGTARCIMGNHEFNAIAWHTPDPHHSGEFMRRHDHRHRQQHVAFLKEVADRPQLHGDLVRWFATLPPWIEEGGCRVVHACWDERYLSVLSVWRQPDGTLSEAGLHEAMRKGTAAHEAVEIVMKGPEVTLPPGLSFRDSYGHERHEVRLAWWLRDATTFRDGAVRMKGLDSASIPDAPLPASVVPQISAGGPIFFGHYWMTGEPTLSSRNAVCVDYSAGRGEPLVAYRWDGSDVLEPLSFVRSA